MLLVALVTRLWRLGYHSIWFDEAVTLEWAGADPAYTWDITLDLVQEKHPPVYYIFLHYWQELLGLFGQAQNDALLRLSGSLLGVLTAAGLLLLARRLSGRPTALLAGLFVALAPALVWYSQELRMFQPAATLAVWAGYFLLRGWAGGRLPTRLGWWAGCALALLAALYSYLFSAFVLPAAGLTLLLLLLADREDGGRLRWGRFAEGAVTLAAVALLFLPLARNAWAVAGDEGAPGRAFASFGAILAHQLRVFTVWRAAWPEWAVVAAVGLFGLLVLAGLLLPLQERRRSVNEVVQPETGPTAGVSRRDASNRGGDDVRLETAPTGDRLRRDASNRGGDDVRLETAPTVDSLHPIPSTQYPPPNLHSAISPFLDRAFLWLWIFVPLLIGGALQAATDTVFAEERYFLFVAPFVLWAAARGAIALGRIRRPALWLAGGAGALLLLAALPALWTPQLARENWRAAVGVVAAHTRASPGLPAAAVAHVDYTHMPVEWYLRREFTFEQLPLYFPFGGALTPDQVEATVAPPLQGIEETGAATLWLFQSHTESMDDGRLVEGWLAARYPLITEQYPAGIKLSAYAVQSVFDALPPLAPEAVRPNVELAPGLALAACEVLTPEVAARDEQIHPPSGWVHLRLWWQATGPIAGDSLSSAQVVGGDGVWGESLARANSSLHRFPTSTWQEGQFVRDELDVNLNPQTPPGTYSVQVGLTDAAGAPVGESVVCSEVTVR